MKLQVLQITEHIADVNRYETWCSDCLHRLVPTNDGTSSSYFHGIINAVGMYDTVLTPRTNKIYFTKDNGQEDPAQLWLKMDEGTGNGDHSGLGFYGTAQTQLLL